MNTRQSTTDHEPPAAPISERRLAANRANAAKSTGPKSDAGKNASSRNSVKHGICAKKFVLFNEDINECQELLDGYLNRFHPLDQVEMDLVLRMAHATWTLRRCWTMSNELLTLQMFRMEAQLAAQYEDFPERTRTAAAFEQLATQPALALLNRYEARLSSDYQRALRTLLELRKNVPVGSNDADPDPLPAPVAPESEPVRTNPNSPVNGASPAPASPADSALPRSGTPRDSTPGLPISTSSILKDIILC